MMAMAWFFEDESLQAVRWYNTAFGFLTVVAFALTYQQIHRRLDAQRVLQFVFLPILFPFFFLVYTEILSLLLVLVGLCLGLRRNYVLAGLASCLSVTVRQNNVVWLALIPLICPDSRGEIQFSRAHALRLLKTYWVFAAGIVGFLVFVIINRGIAVAQKGVHPPALFPGNVLFFLFLYFLFFLPSIVAHRARLLGFVKGNRRAAYAGCALLPPLCIWNFYFLHGCNDRWEDILLRNAVLLFIASSVLWQLLYLVPIFVAAVDLVSNPLQEEVFARIHPFVVLFLFPSWLIDPRYLIIPFVFLLLVRRKESRLIETVTTAVFAAASGLLIWGMELGWFL
jgi:alpha-1,2-glucosyltransferase